MKNEVNIFYCYAHEDKDMRNVLDAHLSTLRRTQSVKSWYDGEILGGAEWEKAIASQLNVADIILLLISPDFIASDHCYKKELMKALERHEAQRACVIPILLRPVDWDGTPFSKLQMLPTGTKAITLWPNRDEAFEDVARGIRKVITTFLTQENQTVKTSAFPSSLPFGSKLLQFSLWKVVSFVFLLVLIVATLAISQKTLTTLTQDPPVPTHTLNTYTETPLSGGQTEDWQSSPHVHWILSRWTNGGQWTSWVSSTYPPSNAGVIRLSAYTRQDIAYLNVWLDDGSCWQYHKLSTSPTAGWTSFYRC